jgi:hypothetical protein
MQTFRTIVLRSSVRNSHFPNYFDYHDYDRLSDQATICIAFAGGFAVTVLGHAARCDSFRLNAVTQMVI